MKNIVKKILKLLLLLIIFLYGAGIILSYKFVSEIMKDAPTLKLEDFETGNSTIIYDANGEIIAEVGLYLRENIEFDGMSQTLIDAFLATEDSRFFEHSGFDIPRFSKAIIENIKSKSFAQGGSTFTMQLLKNTYFQIDADEDSTIATKSIDRKVKEILLSYKLEEIMNKEDILINYLNRINFGSNVRGIEKASQYYFGKSAYEIGLAESALLAGIINQPNGYNPYYNLDFATKRRNTVLDLMLYHGYISKTEYTLAKATKVEDLLHQDFSTLNPKQGANQAYLDTVIKEAIKITGKDPSVTPMKIYTNLDPDIQNKMYDILQGNVEGIEFRSDHYQMAMLSVENSTGKIKGIGGGRNYNGARMFNRATDMYKQPGSSIKPIFTYALGFEHLGWATSHTFTDRPILIPHTDLPIKNATEKYYGDISMNYAFGISLNTPVMQGLENIFEVAGKETVSKYLADLNFTHMKDKIYDTQIAIGGYPMEVSMKELAGAYSMLYNKGQYIEPHTISKIVYSNEEIIIDKPNNKQVLSEEAAYLTTRLTKEAVNNNYDNYMYSLKSDYPVYGKTGTSDYGIYGREYDIPDGAAKDRWMIASSPTYTNIVWEGFDEAIKGETTWLTNNDLNRNLRAKALREILDIEHPNNKEEEYPKDIERPENVVSITHMAGTYPYAELSGESYPVTGLIKKEYNKLVNYYSEYIHTINLNATAKYYRDIETVKIGFNGFPFYQADAEGVESLIRPTCIQTKNGERCDSGKVVFDPYYGAGATYAADIYVNGVYTETLNSVNWPSLSTWVDPNVNSLRACAYIVGADGYSHNHENCFNISMKEEED